MDEQQKRKKLINHPDWEIYVPMKVTWVGFLIAWVLVLALMLATKFIATIGA